jgi:predicted RNA-binding Zn-ribbon protein involved in translation (DUF1610 family)
MARNEAVFYEIKCRSNKKDFYLRYDFAYDEKWVLTYGLKSLPAEDARESSAFGNRKSTIDISQARTGPQYKCPYCGTRGFVRCGSCGKLTCYDHSGHFTCAHCGNSGAVSGQIKDMDGSKHTSQR